MADACLICGAPEGRCANPLHPATADVKTIEWRDETIDLDNLPKDEVIAAERIWREVPIWHSPRTKRVLAYRPGQVVPAEDLEALRVGPDGRQTSKEESMLEGSEPPALETPQNGPQEAQEAAAMFPVEHLPADLETT